MTKGPLRAFCLGETPAHSGVALCEALTGRAHTRFARQIARSGGRLTQGWLGCAGSGWRRSVLGRSNGLLCLQLRQLRTQCLVFCRQSRNLH